MGYVSVGEKPRLISSQAGVLEEKRGAEVGTENQELENLNSYKSVLMPRPITFFFLSCLLRINLQLWPIIRSK